MSLKTEFRIGITTRDVAFGQDCKALIPHAFLDPLFFALAIKAQTRRILELVDSAGHGTGRLVTDQLKSIEIPVPPLAEQRAIAHVLGTIQRAQERTERVVGAARELKRSLIAHLLGPAEDQDNVELGSLIERPQYGYTASATSERVGPRFLRITDIQDARVEWSQVPFCDCPPDQLKRHLLRRGDVLVARIGATTGKAFVVSEVPEDAIFASYLIRLRAKGDLDPEFLAYFTQSSLYWSQINVEKGGRVKTGVNAATLARLQVPHPPIAEQRRVADTLRTLDRKIAAEEQRRAALGLLFDSLLRELMAARLRVDGVTAGLV